MLNFIIDIFDIPLILVLVCLSFCSFFVIKNIYNLFLSLFISIFLIIFATTTILVQQVLVLVQSLAYQNHGSNTKALFASLEGKGGEGLGKKE